VAHDRPERVRALLTALAHDDITVCLHVDRASAFAVEQFVPDDHGALVVVEPRHASPWASAHSVDAITATMRAARRLDPGWFSLISGACWPTRPPAAIVERLTGSSSAGYVEARPIPPQLWARLDQFYLSANFPEPVERMVRRIRVRLPRRPRSRIPAPYGGSAWLDLRGDVLAWLLDRIDDQPGYRRAFAFTLAPDEIYFNTLLMHSPYRDELTNIREPDERRFGLRYMRWEGGWHPAVLSAEDLAAAGRTDCIFARKLP